MGDKNKPPNKPDSLDSPEEYAPRPLILRPRGVEGAPDVPEAKGDAEGRKRSRRSPIPIRPRIVETAPEAPELDDDPPDPDAKPPEIDVDPPSTSAGSTSGSAQTPDEQSPSSADAAAAEPESVVMRPSGKTDPALAEIKRRAAANAGGALELPDSEPVPLKPRPAKVNPNREVEIVKDDDDAGEDEGEDQENQLRLQDRKTGVSRLINDEDFEALSNRLQEEELPGWERSGDKGEGKGGEGDGKVTLLVPAEDGQSGYQWATLSPDDLRSPAARRMRMVVRNSLICAILIGVLVLAAVFGRNAILAIRKAKAEALAAAQPSSAEGLSEEEVQKAEAAANAFSKATDVDTMLKLVRNPKHTEALMREYYRDAPPQPVQLGKRQLQMKNICPAGTFIVLAFETDTEPGFQIFTAQRTAEGPYLIDWEISVGYQPMPLDLFKKQRPKIPQSFRVVATPDNYYDHVYPADDYVCYQLTHPSNTEFLLYGYARKNSQAADLLFVNTAGRSLSLILALRYREDQVRDNRVEITDVVKLDWYY